jgi:hypothetical protein
MIAEAGNNRVPYRLVHFDEQCLGQRNPDIINNQISTSEVCQIEVFRLFNGESVLSQAIEENSTRWSIETISTDPGARGHGFSDIDRFLFFSRR